MKNIIEINDITAPELDVYARTSEVQLLRYYEPDPGLFIVESPKVIERALNAGYEPLSFLVEHKDLEGEAKELLERLFVYYLKHIDLLPGYYLQMLEDGEENDRVVCDYIAGMTDQYALAKYSEYFMPKSWQVY